MNFRPYSNENIELVNNRLFAAFDIGTSNIVCAILDGSSGKEIMRVVDNNSQIIYGKDMEARIRYGEENPERVTAMREVTLHTISRMLHQATENLGTTADKIVLIMVATNSAISSILKGLPLKIENNHFVPASLKAEEVRADSMGLRIHDYGMLFSMPHLGGVLGGDLLAGMIATRIYEKEEKALLVDIGTSAQFVLGNKEKLVCLSGSEKGTGFDGVGISHGLYGSELLETIADYLKSGKIDRNGRLLIQDDILNQRDIDQIHHGKTVSMSALKYLLDETNTDVDEIETVYLSGSFGMDMNHEVLFEAGLLPLQLKGKVQLVGNAALEGSKMCLCDYELFKKAAKIAESTEHMDGFSEEKLIAGFHTFQEHSF